jgi:L-threonylcarbamoyladenylate synthase
MTIENPTQTCPVTTDVKLAADTIRNGRLVAFATETVYGLGANALDVDAVARVFEAKNRPHFDPLIVHIVDESWLERLTSEVPPAARSLIAAFWPGPLTLVLPKTDLVPDLVTSGLPSVAIRMPSHEQARHFLAAAGVPVAAPSANPFGQLSPTTAAHVASTLGDRIDLILDGGPCGVGVESTVVLVTNESVTLLRHGGVAQEEIERVVGPVAVQQSTDRPGAPSPGMLPQHYAPRTPLALYGEIDPAELTGRKVVALVPTTTDLPPDINFAACRTLTTDGCLRTACTRFFATLRDLDSQDFDQIIAWPFPDEGLGRALNDRLRRACHK